MTDDNDSSEIVEIDFEVGHSSVLRSEVTTSHNPPRTHDWKVYVRSADVNGDLSCLIHRCVFHLHPEFPNHKRELKSTPFAIQETGYAGFHLPIEIFFKTKKEPKKFSIDYVLDLHRNLDGHPYRQKESYVRKYRCTFHDPDPDFRQKILAAGGLPSKVMTEKAKGKQRGACRLTVVKIVDSGPIPSKNIASDESAINEEQSSIRERISRPSPPQKRPISPVPTANVVSNKKVKLEPSTNSIKIKQIQTIAKNESASKTTMNPKKSKLASHKSSLMIEDKTSKVLPMKDLNQSLTISDNRRNSSVPRPRSSVKLMKSQSTNDIKPSSQPTAANPKKKEPIPSPLKTKLATSSQNVVKKTLNKKPSKTLIKTESTNSLTIKSPSNITIKQVSSPQVPATMVSSNKPTTSVAITNLKKIPKKPISSSVVEKRSRLSMPSMSLNRNSIQNSQQQQQPPPTKISVAKTQLKLKRDPSSSSVNKSTSNIRTEKPSITKNRSDNPFSQTNWSSSPIQKLSSVSQKSTHSPSPFHMESSTKSTISSSSSPIDTPQLSVSNSPFTNIFQNETHHIQTSADTERSNDADQLQLSDDSDSPHDVILTQSTKITSNRPSYSDRSDTNDSDISMNDDDDDNEEGDDQDLPTSLTNDDLRYKLIFIYKRFQLNTKTDLIIFVRFFKRHQLIDLSTLSTTKTADEMFTYDLFSLSPSHIGELANDLGYTPTNVPDSMK